ncbi:hypothetical protein BJY04DRAFT_182207 [Aspergillus karnatakaensis]|uniref:uncharacterized protein n=1 Tax=Aspergillus karnatakaensis TaxID=1810916 RepID=UPI003CCCE340
MPLRMQQPSGFTIIRHLRTFVLWTLILPAVCAEQTTTESAGLSRLGPDQGIVDIVPVEDDPPLAVSIKAPIASIHHHEHAHRHILTADDTDTLIARAEALSSFEFPTSFDTSLTSNFTTDSCPDFFQKFLSDSTFTDCHAISTLLRDSTGFFRSLLSAATTSRILDIACAADVESCSSTMSDFASDLLDDSNCGQDYKDGNPLVTNAYYNMITYQPIYRATCLQNPDTSNYCFVDAVTNTSNPADYDVYLLPYGSTTDRGSLPTCDSCLQATLDIFSTWAQVEDQPLAESYLPSAHAINSGCGANFANVNITTGVEDEVPNSSAPERLLALSLPVWISIALSIGVAMY